MPMAKMHALGAVALAVWLATPSVGAADGSARFNGTWRVESQGNPSCYASYETARWTIRNGTVVTNRGTGTVSANGRVDMRYVGVLGHTQAIRARLQGNQGTGNIEVEGTQC